ncbi:hypothetical protein VMCG_08503 [Cytospora schulzeri]|uniref:Uncharacterized protein n=1 Tax=Cytospora schulzeri TaxID=448051 RepID=A0A423VWP8_9PEZI|nr:hypothetical protein VMCG_08503 [Valsa malicola]
MSLSASAAHSLWSAWTSCPPSRTIARVIVPLIRQLQDMQWVYGGPALFMVLYSTRRGNVARGGVQGTGPREGASSISQGVILAFSRLTTPNMFNFLSTMMLWVKPYVRFDSTGFKPQFIVWFRDVPKPPEV